ncbi:hypothetical protein SAMN05443529_13910 [Desulfosporosinus hippei DSM 8344]|uniref:Uncharacterized protein n=1 Tax=Desulfosporosinus hippei DSM 8344 TaxID=1121419 RepID=A0A1G8KKC4_9FIRM|nr:hypothetical protein SAMN05443529_13910 [Desulfosporosinus hippei DSM 8344]
MSTLPCLHLPQIPLTRIQFIFKLEGPQLPVNFRLTAENEHAIAGKFFFSHGDYFINLKFFVIKLESQGVGFAVLKPSQGFDEGCYDDRQ